MPAKDTRPAGFTLLEIMVALTVGGIAVSSLYTIGSASTRHFREQQRVSAAQTSLRSAMDQLKHDFQRAGFMSTPQATIAGEVCSAPVNFDPNNRLAAIADYRTGVTAPSQLDPKGLNNAAFFSTDEVYLTGNYATSGEYPGIEVTPGSGNITIPMNWQSFRRDFSDWTAAPVGTCAPAVFAEAFPPGRMVRLHSLSGTYFYTYVQSATCTGQVAAQLTVGPVVPAVCNMNGGWISPVNVLHYGVVNATAAEGDTDQRMAVLRRTEVTPTQRGQRLDIGNVAVDDRALLDYVVRFNVGFMMRETAAVELSFVPATPAAVRANPERVRGVILDVAVRTSQQEFDFTSDVAGAAFKLLDTPGAARVRRAHAELLLSNIASRGL